MLTFDPNDYCRPLACEEKALAPGEAAGSSDALNLLALRQGGGSLPALGGAPLLAGQVLVSAGPVEILSAGGLRVAVLALGGQAAAALCAGLDRPRLLDAADSPAILALMDAFTAEGEALASDARQSALAYTLLCTLHETLQREGQMPPLVAAAIHEIREHYGEVYGIEEVAAALGVSKSHLIRRFTASMGMPPGRYLTLVRIEAARRLLAHRDITLEGIAGLCGFSGANYLCRVFKKETGVSPAVWRRQHAAQGAAPQPPEQEWEDALYL